MSDELSLAIEADFTPPICTYVIDSLRTSCTDAARRHEDEIGCNGNTFGTDNYQFAVFQLRNGLDFDPPGIQLAPTGNELEFRLQIGRFRVAVHRVGSSGADPIESSFPSSPNGPSRLAKENSLQLSLDFPGTFSTIPTNVIIAYMSSPESGLEAVYICVPVAPTEGGRVKEWLFTKCIWRNGESNFGLPPDLPPTPQLPPEVPNRPADITMRPEIQVKD